MLMGFIITVVGQNQSNVENVLDSQSIFDNNYMQVHDEYKLSLDPLNYIYNTDNRNIDDDYLLFLKDVVVVNSVFSDPKRYIYTYTNDNFLDNTLIQENNNGNWEIVSLESFTYDTSGNVLTSQLRVWENGSLENLSRNTYIYNVNNNVETYNTELWIGNTWTNSDRGTYNYNSSGYVLSFLTEKWENSMWENNTYEVYTYDEMGHLLTASGSVWMGNGWASDRRHSYTYDASGNLTIGLSEIFVGDTIWDNLYKENYTYNGANNRLTFLGENWEAGAWVNNLNYTYAYDGLGFLSNLISQIWDNSAWVNQLQEDYYYNDFGGIETVFSQAWESGTWVNSSNSQNDYDEFGNTTKGQFFNWVDGNWGHTLDGVLKVYYNYSIDLTFFTGYLAEISYISILVGEKELQKSSFNSFVCHPNPVSSNSTLSVTVSDDTDAEINIYNIAGNKVQTIYKGAIKKGKHSFIISSGNLSAGMYIAKFISENTSESIKIIISK